MSYINKKEIVPENKTGLEDYKFVTPYPGEIYVYHYQKYTGPLGGDSEGWLCCTEGWYLKDDNRWHETIHCGWAPDRVVETVEDIFNCYRFR